VPVNVPPPPSAVPSWQGLDTATLRNIAIANKIHGCDTQTGVQQNRTIGLAFEAWVLKTTGQLKNRWTVSLPSQERKMANNGVPASVIPEFIADQTAITVNIAGLSVTWAYFAQSMLYEVKAVKSPLTPGTRQWQILGFLDVANTRPSPLPAAPAGPHAPPAVFFITTSNTVVSTSALTQAVTWKVGVWQQFVEYDAHSANPSNPNLRLATPNCLTPTLYPQNVPVVFQTPLPGQSWPINPLTWVTDQEQDSAAVPGDPDPPELEP
jgi:hypothetical protein